MNSQEIVGNGVLDSGDSAPQGDIWDRIKLWRTILLFNELQLLNIYNVHPEVL
jgi:hypothetical protein